jgi:Spy/CpxP family protein refolding chaperone
MSTRLTATLALVLTLLIGIILGALGNRALIRSHFFHGRALGKGMLDRGAVVERMQRQLDVTDAQRDTVHAILQSHADRMLELNREHGEEMMRLMDTLLADLKPVLTDEQLNRFQDHLRRFRLRAHPEPPPGPGDDPGPP